MTLRMRPLAGLTATALVAAGLSVTGVTGAAAARSLATAVAAHGATTAVPVGKLSPRGCATVGTNVACDLFAMTGTTSMLGQPVPIWGFSTTGAPNSATAPGPVLVVRQGDDVSITIHNRLADNVSLALPGQLGVRHGGPVGDDLVGAATGASATYRFTAARPGTFIYEAGHTPQGARQVAMGLAGALVVLPADGTAYGSPGTSYDDDAVLVLSEIDPALNANPTTFDMRQFSPKYRLINGKPFPSTDLISTDQNHTVLLRYVNVGAQTHSMSLLGAAQKRVAQDGHLMAYPEVEVVETVVPGATADTLVVMPSGPESKITLYDASQQLDNNAQTTGDPRQLAFGGMLTFLDTAAPMPSADSVGPVSTRLALSPNPSDGLSPVTITADVSDATTGGAAVSQAEYVIDDAVTVGPGFGTSMTGAFGPGSVSVTGTVPVATLAALDAGKHTVFVRGLDAAGNWGVVGSVVLNLPKTGPQTTGGSAADVPANGAVDVVVRATGDDSDAAGVITSAEYFVDVVGAPGTGRPVMLNRSATIVALSATLPAAEVKAFGEGLHHVFVRSKNRLGLWGPTLDIELPVDLTGPVVDAASIGPNPSNGVLSDKANPGYLVVSAAISDKDAGGAAQSTLVDAEGFLDLGTATPAGGTGFQLVAVDGLLDSVTESVYGLVPVSQVRAMPDGIHHVSVRGQDAAGNWGTLFTFVLTVDKKAPLLSALGGTPNPTNGIAPLTLTATVDEPGLLRAEVWVGTVDPGVGRATGVPVGFDATGRVTVTTAVPATAAGATAFNLRLLDTAGNWSNAARTTVLVQRPNDIFVDGFDGGSLAAWSARTGAVSAVAAAGIPAGTTGLRVALPVGTAVPSFVTNVLPTAETSYNVRFAMNANTLTPGPNQAALLTLFEARTVTNAPVFTLQLRRNAGVAQVRTVLSRTGAAAVNGAWVSLATGPRTVAMRWVAGPATATATAPVGSLVLTINGVAVSTLVGNTSALRVETALLGVTAGVTSAANGVIFIDSFVSTRN